MTEPEVVTVDWSAEQAAEVLAALHALVPSGTRDAVLKRLAGGARPHGGIRVHLKARAIALVVDALEKRHSTEAVNALTTLHAAVVKHNEHARPEPDADPEKLLSNQQAGTRGTRAQHVSGRSRRGSPIAQLRRQ